MVAMLVLVLAGAIAIFILTIVEGRILRIV